MAWAKRPKRASSYIVMSIVGGAVIPPLLGWIADVFWMRVAFIVPLVCFVGVTLYGASWEKLERKSRAIVDPRLPATGHGTNPRRR